MFKMFVEYFAFIVICGTIGATTNAQSSESEEYRLPENVIPLSYILKITPDLETSSFSGKVSIAIKVKFTTAIIKLHSGNLNIKTTKLCQNTDITVKDVRHENDLMIVEFHQPIPHGTTACLSIEFEGPMSGEEKGFYRISYDENGKEKWLAITSFPATYAREAFPCFDDPRFRTPFTISIARKKYRTSRSNMPLKEIQKHRDDSYVWDEFRETPSIPTHLVAFMVGEFSYVENSKYTIKLWSRERVAIYASYATTQSEKALTHIQEFVGIPYRSPKLDVVAVPEIKHQFSEAYGMAMFMEYYIITEENRASQLQKTIVTTSICHQLSRHWVGGVVTPSNWDYSWLTEALAGYMEFSLTPLMEPALKTDEIFNLEVLQPTLWHEVTDQRALTWRKKTADDKNEKYGLISYYKGTSIIRMLEHIISKRSLKSVIRKFIADGRNSGLVEPRNLYAALEYQSNIDSLPLPSHVSISEVMKTWIENPGYPLITILRDYEKNTAIIRQSTYKSRRAPNLLPDQKWFVPITYTTKSKAQFFDTAPSTWSLSGENVTIPTTLDKTEWIISNLQQTGHYRVNYDSHNWNLLIQQLMEDPQKIHYLNRAQLIDDSFSLAFDDQLSYQVPLRLAKYLTKETEILPLQSAAFHLDILFNKYETTKNCIFFQKYIKAIFEKQIERIGFDVRETDSYATKMGRPVIFLLICKIRLQVCVEPALKEYNANVHDISKVQPDLKKLVFCTALRWSENPQEVYNNLLASYRKSDIAYDKRTIIEALGCIRDEELLQKILHELMQSEENYDITLFDEKYVYKSILSSSKGVTATLKFIRSQIPTLSQLNDDRIALLKRLADDLHPKIQSETHVRLLKILENEIGRFDQQKYSKFTESFNNSRLRGIQMIRENNEEVEVMTPVFMDILNIESPKPPSPQASSMVAILPSVFLYIFPIFVIYRSHFLC